MLQSVHVKNLALIDEIEVEFGEGLNILTGETGAGKSIIMGAINLALGGRLSSDMMRNESGYGLAELIFRVDNDRQKKALADMGLIPEEDTLILSRRIVDGRSTCRINGETVTMGQMKAAAGVMINIYGQNEHQTLLDKKSHLQLVDNYGGKALREIRRQVAESYDKFDECKKNLAEADIDESQRLKVLSFLKFETEEIDLAHLTPGEDEALEENYVRMTNARRLAECAGTVYGMTSDGDNSISESLGRAIRHMSEVSGYDRRMEILCGNLTEIESLMTDFNMELSDYCQSLIFPREEYRETEIRLNRINELKSKYGNSIEDILKYSENQKKKIEKLDNYEIYISQLREELAAAGNHLREEAKKLSLERKKEAESLRNKVITGISDLNLAEGDVDISFRERECARDGCDDVEILISLNPGQPLKPLAEVASGGELSRIMLAIKSTMADKDDIPTLIFDEIDTGISGRTAQKVSEKMLYIGKSHQIIAITHLAQIAAMADSHYLIEKSVEDNITRTRIKKLDHKASVEELARILGGAKITDTVVKNAKEMKEMAAQIKSD